MDGFLIILGFFGRTFIFVLMRIFCRVGAYWIRREFLFVFNPIGRVPKLRLGLRSKLGLNLFCALSSHIHIPHIPLRGVPNGSMKFFGSWCLPRKAEKPFAPVAKDAMYSRGCKRSQFRFHSLCMKFHEPHRHDSQTWSVDHWIPGPQKCFACFIQLGTGT